MKRHQAWLACTAAFFCVVFSWAAAENAGDRPAPTTKRIYMMGSSLTDQVKYKAFQAIAQSRGHTHVWGNHGVPGAPISWIWKHRDTKGGPAPFGPSGRALAEFQWDAVTLEPRESYQGDLEAACNYVDYALKKSPDVQLYVFAKWPRIYRGSYDRQWLENSRDIQNNVRLGFEEFLKDLRNKYAKIPNPPLMIPVGHAMHLLELKIQAGLVPGMKSIYDGYSDASHQNHLGEYIVGCTFFATIYGESPVGLPTEPYGKIAPELAAVMQETVWEAVNAHPYSGVKAAGEFKIITPWFPDAIEGEPFSRELDSAFGAAPVKWSLESGELPPGISVGPAGLLSGTPRKAGAFPFTLKAVDGKGRAATRQFSLGCAVERVPQIPELVIPPVSRGQYMKQALRAVGGNGEISWRVEKTWVKDDTAPEGWRRTQQAGRVVMPAGLRLTHTGVLSGAPAVEGVYRLQVIAEDADPTTPDIARKDLTITVTAAGDGVCLASPVEKPPVIDGKLDESFWNTDCLVSKKVKGSPTCTARFGAVYSGGAIYIAVQVTDDIISSERGDAWDRDGIEVYIDQQNDHEKEYNVGDFRAVCPFSGSTYVYNIEEKRVKSAFVRTERGYTAEICIGLNGIRKPNTVYGLDIAINDHDGKETGQLVWQGTADNATDPSNFGALIFLEKEVK